MAHSATLPTITPKPRRRSCPQWCAADHRQQKAGGLDPFHVSPQVVTPIGWAYITQDPGQDPVIVQDVIPTDVPRETMTFKEATETITALTELIGMTLIGGGK